ncbi:helix-turn-helix transcriptional regulator [Intestinibacillus sp. Marseille-P6563]|uniref:helix-turn-helix transcriptional regulator n=1 Tax=Intestinibacillus sp. Marseille-P6563 TaxID=2364792 RepID=UPI000F046071|nr:helix-turn-helix transcriptional regulator [Intestinibacillus sp. Marseille-P6563]
MKRIKALRELRGLSQGDIAKEVNVSQSCVAKWESGGVYPRAQLLPKLAKSLGCTIDQLFEDEVTLLSDAM